MTEDVAKVLEGWKAGGIRYVRFELPDIHGSARSKTVPIAHALSFARKGLNMYGGTISLDSSSFVVPGSLYNEEVNYADQRLVPDPATGRIVPWARDTARFICNTQWDDGTPLRAAPRFVLKQLTDRLAAKGMRAVAGLEYEMYIMDRNTHQPIFSDIQIFRNAYNHHIPLIQDILDHMDAMGVDIITSNCEYGPGQFEINYAPAEALEAADWAYTFKNACKELSHETPWYVTFMTKPMANAAASGCHIHISLVDADTGRNLMLDRNDPNGISELCRHFVQGQLRHADAIMALMAPTVNCYRRFVPHRFAPVNRSWGYEDRSAMVRVKNSFDDATHFENRLPTALANPYLIAAAALAAGLAGLEAGEEPPAPVKGTAGDDPSLAPLAHSLPEALQALSEDTVLREYLGADLIQVFSAVKQQELARFTEHVSDWERREYLVGF